MKTYTFPKLPEKRFDPGRAFQLGLEGRTPILLTEPTEASNWISFAVMGDKVLAMFAMDVGEDGNLVWIDEGGNVKTRKEVADIAIALALGMDDRKPSDG